MSTMTEWQARDLARQADDARTATGAAAGLRRLMAEERAKPHPNPVIMRSAEQAAANWERRADAANAAMLREVGGYSAVPPGGWGDQFLRSDAWKHRAGYVSNGAAKLTGYLAASVEERATRPLSPGQSPMSPTLAPIASRCSVIPASVNDQELIRWTGPLRAEPHAEGTTKAAAGQPPDLIAASGPWIASYLPVSRQFTDDAPALASAIDGRLRRALGLALDDSLVTALEADPDVPSAGNGSLSAALLRAVGSLARDGWGTNLSVLLNPDDYPYLPGDLASLAMLGVTSILPTAALDPGTAFVVDLFSAIMVRPIGPASVLVNDSHGTNFAANMLVILAEQRVLSGVTDPAAARRIGVTPPGDGNGTDDPQDVSAHAARAVTSGRKAPATGKR